MNTKYKWIICGIGLSLLLGGCMNMDNANGNGVDEKEREQSEVKDQYASVQEYKGEGYTLQNGEENDKIAEEHREEVEKAVKDFFLNKYSTEVKVHNIVGNVDGATVFVESTGPLSFYTYAIVPINKSEKKILSDKVWSQEGQVESAITDGLYKQLFAKEFIQLDSFIEKVVAEGEVVGRTKESLENVAGDGYMTPYYFISTSPIKDEAIEPVYELYLKSPDADLDQFKAAFKDAAFDPKNLRISIMLFMKEEGKEPSEKVFNQIIKDIEGPNDFPKGAYSVFVNDNRVHKESFEGVKDNSLERAYPDEIIKE
ncbi:DUF1672 family protein [Rossellomorea aquimaris]|jgi:hypothetical protein|uniref:DUF1672 family protein n=1 Tax=Rossellomorea aquimaris TaxID=189382 RepID=A0A5D4U7F5_9BACI|nr:DUF1672 family protein [Rossellomorea aquimaris]TYS76518.1 DUF1672 family protein [Rossellomorea aquimaris]TYS83108.1 DUF1672 family protein [Rossellomorea aquimaris]